jgi:hypothetical protein
MTEETIQRETPTENSETKVNNETAQTHDDGKKGNYYQKKLAEVLAEKENLATQLENERKAKLVEQNNYKELYELEKNKRSQAEDKASKITQSYFNGLKISAIEQEAIKQGIHDTALEDLSLMTNDMVQIETTSTGNAHVLGAKEFIEFIKEKKPYLFKSGVAPRVNNANPTEVKAKELTPADVVKLQSKDPMAYQEYMKKRYGK